ncbi:MAG: hypothetical protein RLZZ11_1375 [Cyanobacteriota bacterium]|jgi:hypothetical protein
MGHRTPFEWLEEHQARAREVGAAAEPIDFFESGNGAMWFLVIAEGIRALQAFCVSTTSPVLLVSSEDEP